MQPPSYFKLYHNTQSIQHMKKLVKILSNPVTSILFLILVFVFLIDWSKPDYVLIGVTIFYVVATLLSMLTEYIKNRL